MATASAASNDWNQPIVVEAIARWMAMGVSPAQVAALNAVNVCVMNLANGDLGNHLPGQS